MQCKVIISRSLTKTRDIPTDASISGNRQFRDDIPIRAGIVESTVVSIGEPPSGGMLFSEAFTGSYVVTAKGNIKEGGESGNPNEMITTTIMGVE